MIGEQALVDDVRQLSFEAPASLRGGLGLGEFALVVVVPGPGVSGLTHRHDVDSGVELTVASTGASGWSRLDASRGHVALAENGADGRFSVRSARAGWRA